MSWKNLVTEFRILMVQRRGLPTGTPSHKQVKLRLAEINKKLVDDHWNEIPPATRKGLGLVPRKVITKSTNQEMRLK